MEKTKKKATEKKEPAKKTVKEAAPKEVKAHAAPEKVVAKSVAKKVENKSVEKKAPAKKVESVKELAKKEVTHQEVVPQEVAFVEKKVTKAAPAPIKVQAETTKKPARKRGAGAPLSHGVGRRKCAIARVWVRPGVGAMTINEREYDLYFDTDKTRLSATAPFRIIHEARRYDVVATVKGGGIPGQADAVSLGLSRALLNINESWRSALRKAGLLTVDSRVKERKKYGQKAARRKFQFVKR